MKQIKPSQMIPGRLYYVVNMGFYQPEDKDASDIILMKYYKGKDMNAETVLTVKHTSYVTNSSHWNGDDVFFENTYKFYEIDCETVEEFRLKYPEEFI